jgi:hypothetical protein
MWTAVSILGAGYFHLPWPCEFIAKQAWLDEHVQVGAGPLDRAVDRLMRSVYDEQPHGGPADDLEVRLDVREAPGIVAGCKELPEAVVGSHLWSGVPAACSANLSCNEASGHAAVAALSSRVSARRRSRETCICE